MPIRRAPRRRGAFLNDHPPILVDWLPWNHTFGGNHNFNMVLRNGGTLYIDEGKPVPALIGRTVANLKEISPTFYLNVPRGYAALLDHLEADADRGTNSSSASICCSMRPRHCRRACGTGSRSSGSRCGRKVPFISSWGLTETAPSVTMVQYALDAPAGNIGVPGPGIAVKLAPMEDKLEIRVKGPNVTPGYYKAPELTAKAFDAEGWLRTGDAVRLADPADPAACCSTAARQRTSSSHREFGSTSACCARL